MRRAASCVTANIAEGFGRQTYPDRIRFYCLAQGSLTELKNFIIISKDVGYLEKEDFQELMNQATLTHKLLQGLISKSKSFLTPNS